MPKTKSKSKSSAAARRPTPYPLPKSRPAPQPTSNAGSAFGNIGSSVGSFLGRAAGSILGRITGLGDYKVTYNTVAGKGGPPSFGEGNTIVTHREYVMDVFGSTGFSSTSFTINPANGSFLPWLCREATNYEEYKFHGLVFTFKSNSATSIASTNTALGTVIAATQYNPNDVPFSSKMEMENHYFCTSAKPSETFLHAVECKPDRTVIPQLYVAQPSTAGAVIDLRLTNFATFTLATVGMQAASNIGELWVTYQIELIKPRLFPLLCGSGMGFCSETAGIATTGVVAGSLGDGTTFLSTNNLADSCNVLRLSPLAISTLTSAAECAAFVPLTGTYVHSFAPVIFDGASVGHIGFPFRNYRGRTVLVQSYYVGTVITAVQTIANFRGCTAISTRVTFSATATLVDFVFSIDKNAGFVDGDQNAVIAVTSPTATTLTSCQHFFFVVR
jgi:hypothetical protein